MNIEQAAVVLAVLTAFLIIIVPYIADRLHE